MNTLKKQMVNALLTELTQAYLTVKILELQYPYVTEDDEPSAEQADYDYHNIRIATLLDSADMIGVRKVTAAMFDVIKINVQTIISLSNSTPNKIIARLQAKAECDKNMICTLHDKIADLERVNTTFKIDRLNLKNEMQIAKQRKQSNK